MRVGKEGNHMNMLYQYVGYAVWYGTFISALSAILAIPFIWMPSVWHYSIAGIEITKYIICIIATILDITNVTITLH